ncbi:HNH endonuclease signature motif containing protein [Glycomyces sp. NPDC047369]
MTADPWASVRTAGKTLDDYPPPVLDPETGCIRWQGPHDSKDYGVVGGNSRTKQRRAHNATWERHRGPIPDGHVLDHVWDWGCRWKDCVNLDHLEVVTVSENNRRANKNRAFRALQRREMYRRMWSADV